MDETTFMYLTCDLPAPPLYPDEMRENIIPQVPLFGILNKFNGLSEKEYKTYKDSTLKRFEITQLPPFIILYIKVDDHCTRHNGSRVRVRVSHLSLSSTSRLMITARGTMGRARWVEG